MKGIILAAGKGTRLKALQAECPKPLIPVGGQPIIERIIRCFQTADIRDIIIVIGCRGVQIQRHLGSGQAFDVSIEYLRQGKVTGTAKALALCRPLLGNEPFFLSYGDILCAPQNYLRMCSRFRQSPCDALLAVNWVDDPYQGGAVYCGAQNRIVRIVEKPPKGSSTTHWNSAGCMILTPNVFQHIRGIKKSERGEYELASVLASMLRAGANVRAYPIIGYWADLGTPQDIALMNQLFKALEASSAQ
jgi:dTDP-glucose pyrophosphorylase